MNNDDLKDEEYRFPEYDDAGTENPYGETKSYKMKMGLGRKHIIIGLIVILLVFALYEVIGSMMKSSKPVVAPTAATTPIPPEDNANKAVPPPAPPANHSFLTQTMAPPNNGHYLNPVDDGKWQEVNAEVSVLKQNLGSTQARLQSIESTLATLSANIQQQDEILKALYAKEQKAKAANVQKQKKIAKRIVYYLDATIPGRAWVVSPSGSSTTLKVGDTLSGYGTITNILPNEGLVETSSGRRIEHRPGDS